MTYNLSTNDSLAEVFARLANSKLPADEKIHILLSDGEHHGLEHERIFYNLPNPLVIESESADSSRCALRSENCEAFHKDTENRAVLTFGENCTSVMLKNFTIENTHVKTCDDASLGNQAEAICFHCQNGKLDCEGMRFISRQDTIHVKGFSRFKNCFVTGDVDFIWGYCDTSVFENCVIHTRSDNRGSDRPAYVLQSRALNGKPGFVFINCDFTADDRGENAQIFIGRSQGTGKPTSVDRWDSIALIGCKISERYDLALWTDENGTRAVYPEKGSAFVGWRQFGTKILHSDGTVSEYDDKFQEKHGYTVSENEKNLLILRINE
jgi:pectinesterase